jgi:hypothetical protein
MVCAVSLCTSDCYNVLSYECMNRCTADRKNLDGGGVRRSHEHTQLLMDTFSVKTLWDNHGIVADILVSHF